MDPPGHTRLRRLLTGEFTVPRMQRLESRIREIAVEHIEAMCAGGNPADLVTAFALPVPSLVICELLGVDYAERAEFQERSAWPNWSPGCPICAWRCRPRKSRSVPTW